MEGLGIDIKLLIAQLVNFALFTFLFARFISKPLMGYIASQKKSEDDKAKLLAELEERDVKMDKQVREVLVKATKKAEEVISAAEGTATKKATSIIDDAQTKAAAILEKQEAQLETERAKLYADLKKHIITTSEALVEASLKDVLKDQQKKEVMQAVLAEVAKSN